MITLSDPALVILHGRNRWGIVRWPPTSITTHPSAQVTVGRGAPVATCGYSFLCCHPLISVHVDCCGTTADGPFFCWMPPLLPTLRPEAQTFFPLRVTVTARSEVSSWPRPVRNRGILRSDGTSLKAARPSQPALLDISLAFARPVHASPQLRDAHPIQPCTL